MRHNFSSTLTGNVVYAASQFGMLAALARLTSPAEVGLYAFALATTGPVFVFANLKLRQVQATDAEDEFSFAQYFGQRLVTSTLVAAGLVIVAPLVVAGGGRAYATLLAVTAFKFFESTIDILYGALQRHERMGLIARSQVLRGLTGFVLFAGVLGLTQRVDLAAAAVALGSLPAVVVNLSRVSVLGVSVRPSLDARALLRLTRLALPLGVAVAVNSIMINLPRYFIQNSEGVAQLGVFAALAYVLTATGTVVAALSQAASPRLSRDFAAGRVAAFRRTLAQLVSVAALLGSGGLVAALLFGKPLLRLVFGDVYAEEKDVLVVLTGAAALQYGSAFLGTAVNAMRRFAVQLPLNVASLAMVLLVAAWAVPRFGIMGGALALLAGQALALVMYIGLFLRVVRPALRQRGRSGMVVRIQEECIPS